MNTATSTLDRPTSPTDHAPGFFAHHGLWAPGVRLFRQLGFAAKSGLISLAFMLPMALLVVWTVWSHGASDLRARQAATRQHVEIAHGVLAWAHAEAKAGRIDDAQARKLARSILSTLRYDGNEYFWINDLQPRVVMHPIKPELEGREVGDMKDPQGLALFRAFVDTVQRQREGFVGYQWPKPGSDVPVDKVSYVKGFEPWGWIVGSGVYVGDLQAAQQRRMIVVGAVVAAVLLLAGYLFLSFFKVMHGGLAETRRHLRAMTSGDLTTSPSPWGRDEAAQLMLELRSMQDSMRSMVSHVRHSARTIVHSSSEIAAGAMNLSARTEQAAASLEQSAASMEQIGATVRNTSDHTSRASDMARSNAQTAVEGGRSMHSVVATMEQIQSSSARIGEITGTIDAIAFQTNILALNAAVEAARAGDQGRGFAVVAAEVRMLAQRSAEAAREIKSLIGSSLAQVEQGTTVVRDAGARIEAVVEASRRVDGLLGEVANGAREQAQGVAQIGQAVGELDRMTQQNAALVEQTAAASTAMQQQAAALADAVARFRLPEGAAASLDAAPVAPAGDFDFDQAIEAHRAWKVKLRQAIADRAQLDAETLCRDDQCPLGKWIHGPGGARWGSRPGFTALTDKHAEFHREAAAAARRINAADYTQAERLIGAGSRFSDVSTEVVALLAQARRGL